jgi:hypothetical protein
MRRETERISQKSGWIKTELNTGKFSQQGIRIQIAAGLARHVLWA